MSTTPSRTLVRGPVVWGLSQRSRAGRTIRPPARVRRVYHRPRGRSRRGAGPRPVQWAVIVPPPNEVRCGRRGGGDEGTRTPDPLLAKEVLSQLSYIPTRPPV